MNTDDARGYTETMRLYDERPDLIPLLKRCVANRELGYIDGEDPDALAELERRGLISNLVIGPV